MYYSGCVELEIMIHRVVVVQGEELETITQAAVCLFLAQSALADMVSS